MPAIDGTLVARVAELGTDPERERFFAAHPDLVGRDLLVTLCDEAVRLLREDLDRAERIKDAAAWLARKLDDDFSRGRYLRTLANIRMFRRDHRRALDDYRAALELFDSGGHQIEAALTRTSASHSLVHLGRFEEALDWLDQARETFLSRGNELHLARVDFNTGTLLARQDRFDQALQRFESAHESFRRAGDADNVGISLRNIAVCLQDLNRLSAAEDAYERARAYCAANGLKQLGLEVDCNAAYLHFLRGEYAAAIRGFELARRASEELEDRQHLALVDLDQAEVYLELNLPAVAERLARKAFAGFDRLGMGYEAAKSLVFQALAALRGEESGRAGAIERLTRARAMFVAEGNRIWPSRIDLYRAILHSEDGDLEGARRLAASAAGPLAEVPALGAVSHVFLAQLEIWAGDAAAALHRTDELLEDLGRRGLRGLEFRVRLVRGQAQEASRHAVAARRSYLAADRCLQQLRGQLPSDELKIAYLQDKLAIYDGLVRLAASGPAEVRSPRAALLHMEQAKSRGLVDLLATGIQTLPARTADGSEVAAELRRLREEVSWRQRRIDRAEAGEAEMGRERLARLRRELLEAEQALLAALRKTDAVDHEYGSLQVATAVEPEILQGALPSGTLLLEYYIGGGQVTAALVSPDSVEIVRLGDAGPIEEAHRSLRFQLGKFTAVGAPDSPLRKAASRTTARRLQALYRALIEPLEGRLDANHLVVVPHDFLHWIPFHALGDGSSCLLDRLTVSLASSASVFQLCAGRPSKATGPPLVLGVVDDRAPLIGREVREVAAALPGSILLQGPQASLENLRRHGETARIVHLATHGLFRRDHPMFSAIQLADGRLSVLDLYALRLQADLVVLSGCSTGLNVVRAGDEQVGLTRGLLYAGARAVLVTLWDVNDESTASFMSAFYPRLTSGASAAEALAGAVRELRASYPEPYHWAPFVLTGWPFDPPGPAPPGDGRD